MTALPTHLVALKALTIAALREQHDFSIAGLFKWLVEPLSYMLVYFVLIAAILNRPRDAYPLFLLCALVPWRYFTGAIFDSMFLTRGYGEILQNRSFLRELLPLTLLLAEAASFLIALSLFLPMMVLYEIPFTTNLLWLPLVLGILMLLTSGPAYMTALLGLYFPDLRGAFQNLVRVLFFVSSGLVPIGEVPGDRLPNVLKANPLSGVFDSFRAIFLEAERPSLWDVLYPAAFGIVLLLLGLSLFRWRRSELPKEV